MVSPKSLLRHQSVAADLEELTTGHFQTVIEQPTTGKDPKKLKKSSLLQVKWQLISQKK